MTIEEYNKVLEEKINSFSEDNDDFFDELSAIQYGFMYEFKDNYEKNIDADDNIRQKIVEVLGRLIEFSRTGQVIMSFDTENEAREFEEVLFDDLNEMLLETEVYEEEGKWIVDIMFGGNYCPDWDEWENIINERR